MTIRELRTKLDKWPDFYEVVLMTTKNQNWILLRHPDSDGSRELKEKDLIEL